MSFTMSLCRGWRMISTPTFRKIRFINNIRCAHVITSTQQILLPKPCESNLQIYRLKSTKTRKNKDDSDSEDSDDDDDDLDAEKKHEHIPGAKILDLRLTSTRIDKVLNCVPGKHGRKEIELAFYSGRILRNGKKVARKSEEISEGDVVDFVRHSVRDNPALLVSDRIEVLSLSFKPESLQMKCAYSKSMHIKAKLEDGDESSFPS